MMLKDDRERNKANQTKESCGYLCLRWLYQQAGKEIMLDDAGLHPYRTQRQLSFVDLLSIVSNCGHVGHVYVWEEKQTDLVDRMIPFIAHLSWMKYAHFVVLLRYRWWVKYVEPGHGIRYLPRPIFDLFFTKKIFKVDCF